MSTKKTTAMYLATLIVVLGLLAWGPQPATPYAPPVTTEGQPLMELLPEKTVAAVELRDLDRRWPEIRALPAVARLQDRLLSLAGLAADDVPSLAADRAVLALVEDDDGRSLIPTALLRPARIERATANLEAVAGLALLRAGDTLWLAPRSAMTRLARLPSEPRLDRNRNPRVHEFESRLPAGGLVRGWLEPERLHRLLLNRVEAAHPAMRELLQSLGAAKLAGVSYAGFRRDLSADGFVTDAVIGLDPNILPASVVRALASPASPPVLPDSSDIVAGAAFPLLSEAALDWLQHAARLDPRGPLRNLDFWIDEFEERTGLDMERDLLDLLGDRGWVLVLEGPTSGTLRLAAVIETHDAPRLEATLVALGSWWAEQAWGRALGLAGPRVSDEIAVGRTVHTIALRSPFGTTPGPAFAVTDAHLVLGSGKAAVARGIDLLRTRAAWPSILPEASEPSPPHEAMFVRGPTLWPIVRTMIEPRLDGAGPRELARAIGDLGSELDRASLRVYYEPDAVRLSGSIRFAGTGE